MSKFYLMQALIVFLFGKLYMLYNEALQVNYLEVKMLRKLFLFIIFLTPFFCDATLPEINSKDVKIKIEEILKSHVTHKSLTTNLIERTFQNSRCDLISPTVRLSFTAGSFYLPFCSISISHVFPFL